LKRSETEPMTKITQMRMLDVSSPRYVEVQVSRDHKRLWVNVDGACLLRCSGMAIFRINDERERKGSRALYSEEYEGHATAPGEDDQPKGP